MPKPAFDISIVPDPASFLSAMTRARRSSVRSWGLWGDFWVRTMSGMSSEIAHFVTERMQKDLKFQHAVMHCADADALRALQMEFLTTALEEYVTETGKLASMGQDAVMDGLTAAGRGRAN